MRKRFSSYPELCHAWANSWHDEGYCGNMFFKGSIIYSYGTHFPIAKHAVSKQGFGVTFFTTKEYSNTTAKHKSMVHAAIPRSIIYCKNVDIPNTKDEHDNNLDYMLQEMMEFLSKHGRARESRSHYYTSILNAIINAEDYCRFYEIKLPENIAAISKHLSSPEFIAATSEYEAKLDKIKEFAQQKSLEKWFDYKTNYLKKHKRDYLRLSKDGDKIETSQGLSFGLAECKLLWLLIKNNHLAVADKVLGYDVLKSGDDIKIGCHDFPRSYLVEFGEKIFN